MSFTALTVSLAVAGAAGGTSAYLSGRQAKKAEKNAKRYEQTLADLEANRQDIVNPYANISNPYNNLQVSTAAAELQGEETDLALANTLDYLKDTGASAGGATAIAQEAARSKLNISKSIEQQEARNAELRARGELDRQQMIASGDIFAFNAQENREMQQLSRYAGLGQENRRLQAQGQQGTINALSSLGGAAASVGAGYATGQQ